MRKYVMLHHSDQRGCVHGDASFHHQELVAELEGAWAPLKMRHQGLSKMEALSHLRRSYFSQY